MTPALRSLRLILHPYSPMLVTQEHVDWLNDRELMQYSEQRLYHHTLKTQYDWVRSFPTNGHFWTISCQGHDIGTITAYTDASNGTANMGILLGNKAFHGHGYGSEAWSCVMEWLFQNGIRKVEAGCMEDNVAMRRLATSCGMVLEAEIPGHFKVGDKVKAMILYGKFDGDNPHHSEWEKMWAEPFWKPGEAE